MDSWRTSDRRVVRLALPSRAECDGGKLRPGAYPGIPLPPTPRTAPPASGSWPLSGIDSGVVPPRSQEGSMRIRDVVAMPMMLGLVLAACAGQSERPNPFSGVGDATIQITVDNQDWRDATLYADWNGVRQRIGMVVGKT